MNSQGEEVDEIDWVCPECGESDFEEPDEEHAAYAGCHCLACGYVDM